MNMNKLIKLIWKCYHKIKINNNNNNNQCNKE